MYFSNIAYDELQHFHGTVGADFSMSLTDLLASELFEIEEILEDELYRVYPLFYCREITSSNSEDINLDNRCLILHKTSSETYLSFMTDQEKSNAVLDPTVLNIKGISDTLSTDEFNALVYMLRSKGVVDGQINFEDQSTVTGMYGTYKISDNNQLRNDTGFIINDKIKENPLTVKLTNPFFLSAKYTLTFTVTSITGANVCDTDPADYKTKSTFSIVLVNGQEVSIPVNSYTNDGVLGFDVDVAISFDVPEIVNGDFTLSLTASDELVLINEDLTLTATLAGEGNVEGYNVEFFEDGTSIGTETTGNDGKAILEDYTCETIGQHVYSCQVLGLTDNVSVRVGKYDTTVTLASDKNTAYIPTNFTISGALSDENGVLGETYVKLYNNNQLLCTFQTENDGTFSKTITAENTETFNLQIVYEGDATRYSCESGVVTVTARKYSDNLTISADKTSLYCGQSVTITGTLKDELGNNINGAVNLYEGNTQVAQYTVTDGSYTFYKQYNSVGTYNLKVVYGGDESHNSATSTVVTVSARKYNANLTANLNKSTMYYSETVTVSGTLKDELGNNINGAVKLYEGNTYVGQYNVTNGSYSFSKQYLSIGTYQLSVSYAGDGTHNGASTGNKSLTVNKAPTTVTINAPNQSYVPGEVITIGVSSSYGNFTPSSIVVGFNGESTTISTRNNQGLFEFTLPDVQQGDYNLTVSYAGNTYYSSSSSSKNISIVLVDTITLTKSGNNYTINFKKNNANVANTSLKHVLIYTSVGGVIDYDLLTDSNGNYTLTASNFGVTQVKYAGITSNTIT